MVAPLALTGTPGTGKSSVAAALAPRFRSIEVADLARILGVARTSGRGVEVDVAALARAVRPGRGLPRVDLIVGHLSHLLPLRHVVVLRCHPRELERRLERGRPAPLAERRENLLAEALDVVLAEARRPGRRIYEIDTTGRTADRVARDVAERLRRDGPASYGRIDWLSDPWVTKHLLDWAR